MSKKCRNSDTKRISVDEITLGGRMSLNRPAWTHYNRDAYNHLHQSGKPVVGYFLKKGGLR